MTDFVVSQFIGGRAFFLGMALCLLGCALKAFFNQTKIQSVARATILAGVVVVVLSAAPFSFWVYGVFFALVALFAFRPIKWQWWDRKMDCLLLLLLLMLSLLMVRAEVVHSMPPKISLGTRDTLYVVGDSLCMGADPPGKNWPDLLGDLAKLKVRNLSFGGARLETSLDQVQRVKQGDALVILELGGNDLLGGTTIPKYRENLEKMLARLCGPHRRVAMIELPLPPFYNRFGMVQRDVAKSYGVTLIPKHCLAKIICTPGATVDGLHLSNAGHGLFANALFEMLTQTQ
jgi:acyl-CoA thioesterase I